MVKYKYIKDPIYGFIKTNLIKFIDHSHFQRLRYIKQTGFAYLTYPGCNHTRFEHSLGCFYLTNECLSRFKELNKEEKLALKIYALFHDLGHGPFSHSSERALKFDHEKFTDKKINEILEENNLDSLKDSLEKIKKSNYIKLITGDFGTDRMDYLIRDSYYSGVNYGLIDWKLIIKEMKIIENKICFNIKIKSSLDNFLLARHFMFKNLYHHKTNLKFDAMFEEAIKQLFNYFKREEIYEMTDFEIMYIMKKYKIKIFEDILNRRLWKTVFICDEIEEIPEKYFDENQYLIINRKLKKLEINTYLYDENGNIIKYEPKILEYINNDIDSKIFILKKE